MRNIQATNDFVFIVREKAKSEDSGLIIPSGGREKPHEGTIHSIGSLVQDKAIKGGKNKKALFHKGAGFEIEYEGTTYLVLNASHIIAVV
jgi:chaperonin GroES